MRLTNGEVLLRWPLSTHIITAGWTYNDGSAHNAIDLRAAAGTRSMRPRAAPWTSCRPGRAHHRRHAELRQHAAA